MTKKMKEDLITLEQMGKLLNRTPKTILKWVKQGHFPEGVKINNKTLGWTVESYEQWLDEHQA